MLSKRKHSGFSLVELMVAIVIVGILLALAIPSYKSWIQNQQIRAAAESILNGIQLARTEAVKNNSKVRFVLCAAGLPSWEVLAASTVAAAPAVSVACGAGSPAPAQVGEVRVQERSVQEGSRFAQVVATSLSPASGVAVAADGSDTVTFNSFGRVVANTFPSSATSLATIEVATPKGDRPLRITVGAGGNVRMCDPSPKLKLPAPSSCY